MIPWLWTRANGGAHFWDGKNGERTALGTRGDRSSFEGTGGWETPDGKTGSYTMDAQAWGTGETAGLGREI